jgi:D-alanine-D-alanine ligase
MKRILLLKGGGSSEHEVSLVSAIFIKEQLELLGHQVVEVLISDDKAWLSQVHANLDVDYCIPCLHGSPGETGEIPALLELYGIPYLGCGPEASVHCINKVTTKLWLSSNTIVNTPFLIAATDNFLACKEFLQEHTEVFVKASNQGSSVGCFFVDNADELKAKIAEAFKLSPFVLLEKNIIGRELEVSVYEYQGKIHTTKPGEISCPQGFYDYEQKYSQSSKAQTHIVALNISDDDSAKIQALSLKAFKLLKLKDLSRIDFFYTDTGEIYLNEINTFPGMTPISMFPKMMENAGVKFVDFLADRID